MTSPTGLPMQDAPIATVFLDIDDVVCLSDPYGGYDAIEAVNSRRPDADAVYTRLFAADAVAALRQVHDSMGGRLRYVISSTWREFLGLEQLQEVFRRSGLAFVSSNLHGADRWSTPISGRSGRRADDIAAWLDRHHAGEPFAIVDDGFSGVSLAPALTVSSHPFFGRVVLCEEGVGLTPAHVQPIVAALRGSPAGLAYRREPQQAADIHAPVAPAQ